jgi:hypothetical protein
MIGTNPNWDDANELLAKKPIYALAFSGVARVYTTHDLTAEGITGITDPALDYKPWLKIPRGSTQSIDVLNGSTSIGELECEVVDVGGTVRAAVGATTYEGKLATLSVGYPGLDWTEFVPLNVQQVYKVTPNRTYNGWLFRARDRWMNAKRTVYMHPENGNPLSESNPWILQGTPAEIIQAVLLFGLGRPLAEIDRAGLLALDAFSEGLFRACRPFEFHLIEPFEAKQFLETEIFKPCAMYPIVAPDGTVSARAFRGPAAGPGSAFSFTADNCIALPEIDRQPIVNTIVFRIDADSGGEFQNQLVYVDATSISTYGRGQQQVIESKGLRTAWGAQWFCEEVASRLFKRFAGTPTALRGGAPLYSVDAFLLSLPVWVGDYVTLNHAKVPNLLTGGLGVNRLVEVIDRDPDYSSGRMRYTLLDTGLTGAAVAYCFSPSSRDFLIGTSPLY